MNRSLIFLALLATCLQAYAQKTMPTEPPAIDPARAAAAGLRKLEGKHLTIYTDLPASAEVDALPRVFDQAVPQWAAYFHVPADRVAGWHVTCFVIGDRGPFDALGLMPTENDQFVHGIAYDSRLWLYDQPTAYYRRHLLLHEGVHAFMARFLGGCGPGWYMEGTAELLATHRMEQKGVRNLLSTDQEKVPDTFLRVGIMPNDRREVPMLGRVKLVRDAVAEDRVLPLEEVMQLDNRRQLDNEAYAWCWAVSKWLDSHPRYRDRFRQLYKHVNDADFNERVRESYADDWSDLATEWQAYVATLDHGYDFERMAIEFRPGEPLKDGKRRTTTIAADRGWQSSGVWLEAGRHYLVAAEGRYEIAREESGGRERVWTCEPGGVTIEYRGGFPLGMLLGAVDARTTSGRAASEKQAKGEPRAAEAALAGAHGFAHPFAIGLQMSLTPAASGTLYLRVNDSGGKLVDNRGSLTVTIEEVEAAARDAR